MFKKALLVYKGNVSEKEIGNELNEAISTFMLHIKELVIVKTEEEGEGEEICKAHGNEVELILIYGGDGTVHECLNGLKEINPSPVIGVLPGGTANDFSRSLNVPQNIKKAAEALMNDSKPINIDVGQADDRVFTNFLGVGLVSDTSESVNENIKNLFGKAGYYLSAFQHLTEGNTFSFVLKHGETVVEDEAVMILIANGKYLGGQEIPGGSISPADGLLDVFIVYEAGLPLLKDFLVAKRTFEWNQDKSQVVHFQASSLHLDTSVPQKVDMDGEIYAETPVEINVVSKQFSFLVGNSRR
ncbi:diacylglycerol/lipid kinase family protein [Thalassorhabdus alkalitolerans]|uniref:Diacylglycerol/lipid kinase family protein n=1 Tax=Thalassorhabdus alkalitolerans TaxID=2282697 RepID=A0ABW0YR18_9BACI